VWRIATFLAGVPLIWAASVVTGSLFFQYTTGTTIPQVDFNSPGMNVNFTTVNGLFNVNYFVTFVLLLGFSLLLFAASSYTFLVYSLTPFMPVRSGEIAKWMVSLFPRVCTHAHVVAELRASHIRQASRKDQVKAHAFFSTLYPMRMGPVPE